MLIELRRVFGVWLISGEYLQFVELRRRAALQLGWPEPRLPTIGPLNGLFGGYAAAIAEARSQFGEALPVGSSGAPSGNAKHSAAGSGALVDETLRGQLHPVAASWWRVARGMSETDRRFLYLALGRRTRSTDSFLGELMLSAIARCRDDLGQYPSYRGYSAWREAQSFPDEWPTAAAIKWAYRRWGRAVDCAGAEPTADITVYRLRGRSAAFSAAEILAGVDVCAKEWRRARPGVPLRFVDYRLWPKPS